MLADALSQNRERVARLGVAQRLSWALAIHRRTGYFCALHAMPHTQVFATGKTIGGLIGTACLKPGVIGLVAARLQKEEASSEDGVAKQRAAQMNASGGGVDLDGEGDPLPALLQNVDERTQATPWWMDENVVASIERSERAPEPEPEPEPEGGETDALDGLLGEAEEAKAADGGAEGVCVKDKAAALEAEGEAEEQSKGKKKKKKKK